MKSIGLVPLITLLLLLTLVTNLVYCGRPSVVNVGAIFTFDSVIGNAAKAAMEMAVDDINKDPRILDGTKLNLIMEDSNCSVFIGSIKGSPNP